MENEKCDAETEIEALSFTNLINEIVKRPLLLKLNKNNIYIVDGKILYFSIFIKRLCCNSKDFNHRLNLENVEREPFTLIIHFITIIEWNGEKFIFDVKAEELNRWFEVNKKSMPKVEEVATYLKINIIFDYLNYRDRLNQNVTFKTGIDYKCQPSLINKKMEIDIVDRETKNFQEAFPPHFNPENLSLEMPFDISVVKKNATKNFTQKGKFNKVFEDPNLNKLVDALVSDSFWFVVCFFRMPNLTDKRKTEEIKKVVNDILKRISTNYFKFFINLCDDDCIIKKKDPILNMFRDFMSQCVFYSLYLAFPKSRDSFNDEFRTKLISLFSYIFNGIDSHNYSIDHWNLDLGKGNIINKEENREKGMNLPEIADFRKLIKYNIKNGEFAGEDKKKSVNSAQTSILNTPLYRFYAENNRFETLNLIKPIKFSQRKVVNIEQKTTQDLNYLDKVKDYKKLMSSRKKTYDSTIIENEKVFNEKMRDVKGNTKRLKKEFGDIRVQRYQEYANYCIFISSK